MSSLSDGLLSAAAGATQAAEQYIQKEDEWQKKMSMQEWMFAKEKALATHRHQLDMSAKAAQHGYDVVRDREKEDRADARSEASDQKALDRLKIQHENALNVEDYRHSLAQARDQIKRDNENARADKESARQVANTRVDEIVRDISRVISPASQISAGNRLTQVGTPPKPQGITSAADAMSELKAAIKAESDPTRKGQLTAMAEMLRFWQDGATTSSFKNPQAVEELWEVTWGTLELPGASAAAAPAPTAASTDDRRSMDDFYK